MCKSGKLNGWKTAVIIYKAAAKRKSRSAPKDIPASIFHSPAATNT
jgi:hypothetical protein